MHNSILSKRNYAAHTRIMATAAVLAEHLNIDPAKVAALTPNGKDKDVRMLHQREAVANLLDDIALSLGIDLPANGQPIEPPADAPTEEHVLANAPESADGDDQALTEKESSDEPGSDGKLPPPVVEEGG